MPSLMLKHIVFVTKSWWSNADLAFSITCVTDGVVSHTRSYPLSIKHITHLFITDVLQNDVRLKILPLVMGSEPAGS